MAISIRKFGQTQDYIYEEFFDNVVVASGHFDVPFVPEILDYNNSLNLMILL